MKNSIVKTVAALMAAMTVVSGCSRDRNVNLTDAQKEELLEKAYVYTLPLMLIDATYLKT